MGWGGVDDCPSVVRRLLGHWRRSSPNRWLTILIGAVYHFVGVFPIGYSLAVVGRWPAHRGRQPVVGVLWSLCWFVGASLILHIYIFFFSIKSLLYFHS